ncbi:hypothetical protein NPIL_302581, partial [Nephila pilipes]
MEFKDDSRFSISLISSSSIDTSSNCERKQKIESNIQVYTSIRQVTVIRGKYKKFPQTTMESENESLQDHDMSSNASSSRASTPSIPEHFHSACLRRKLIEQELKTYTDSIDHTEILMKNLERQGLLDHPIYTNHRTMIHGLRRQRDLLS